MKKLNFAIAAISMLLGPCAAANAQPAPGYVLAQPGDPGNFVVRPWHGRPTVWRDGVPLLLPTYCNAIIGWGEPQHEARWKSWVDNFIKSGIKVYQLDPGRYHGLYGQSSFWPDENVYADAPSGEPMSIDKRAEYILSKVPDALFIIRPWTYAPTAWMAKNPSELQTDSAGKTYEPSWASDKYLSGLTLFLQHFVRYHESRPWTNRIIGYEVIPLGEGYPTVTENDNFYDRSPAMQRAWHSFLLNKYGSDDALQKAWGDDKASLDSASIPTDAQLRAKIDALPHWPSGAQMRVERDYIALQEKLHARWIRTIIGAIKSAAPHRDVLIGIDAMKEPMLGWQIQESFGGQGLGPNSFSFYAASGSMNLGPLLDMPELTNLITPEDYTARQMGSGFEAEGIDDSLVLRGKTFFVENDARTFLGAEEPGKRRAAGAFNNLAQVRAGFFRNTSMALSRGLRLYYMDISGSGSFYGSEAIQKIVREDKALYERGSAWPHRETQSAIAVLIDDESPKYENFTTGFQQLAVVRQRVEGLALAGIPYRLFLLSDLKKPNFPSYHCYYFPNLFKVDSDTLALLHQKIFRNGSMAIFGPGTGITDGETVSAQGAEKLLGIPMRLVNEKSNRRVLLNGDDLGILGAPQLPSVYGDSYNYGPVLAPDRTRLRGGDGIMQLGDLVSTWNNNTAGLVLKDFGNGGGGNGRPGARGQGDYAVAFTAALPMPAPLLRALAAYGGCNVWCHKDAVIAASDTMVSLHSARSGTYIINLPRRCSLVLDAVTGKLVGRNMKAIRVRIKAPETRTFLLQ